MTPNITIMVIVVTPRDYNTNKQINIAENSQLLNDSSKNAPIDIFRNIMKPPETHKYVKSGPKWS